MLSASGCLCPSGVPLEPAAQFSIRSIAAGLLQNALVGQLLAAVSELL